MTVPDCFACNPAGDHPTEAPFEWTRPRLLCSEHNRSLKLWNNDSLDAVLERVEPGDHPLEGSLLGWIYNPVYVPVEGRRDVKAWVDFVAGARLVRENRFSTETYFDFRAMEVPAAVDLLHVVRSAVTENTLPKTRADLINIAVKGEVTARSHLPKATPRGPLEGLSDVISVWNFECRLRRLRARLTLERVRLRPGRGEGERIWPESWNELQQWIEECSLSNGPLAVEPETEDDFVKALLDLARRRFPLKRAIVDRDEATAAAYLQRISCDILLDASFRCGKSWVAYCRHREEGLMIGGAFAVIVDSDTGAVRQVTAASMLMVEQRMRKCERPTLLCAPPEAQSPALINRVADLTGSSVYDIVAVRRDDLLFIGSRVRIDSIHATLREEGFSVYVRE
jgi:hypothetical protein